MIRDSSGKLVPTTWDEAMNLMVKKATDSLKQRGSNSDSTGQGLLEDYYTIAKFR
ncbi:hypothetical protein M4A92_17615, partial [Caldibacillus thermoamylovorans]|nr:hypothetical protein [Caldibacillus thermoamylovorans]